MYNLINTGTDAILKEGVNLSAWEVSKINYAYALNGSKKKYVKPRKSKAVKPVKEKAVILFRYTQPV